MFETTGQQPSPSFAYSCLYPYWRWLSTTLHGWGIIATISQDWTLSATVLSGQGIYSHVLWTCWLPNSSITNMNHELSHALPLSNYYNSRLLIHRLRAWIIVAKHQLAIFHPGYRSISHQFHHQLTITSYESAASCAVNRCFSAHRSLWPFFLGSTFRAQSVPPNLDRSLADKLLWISKAVMESDW